MLQIQTLLHPTDFSKRSEHALQLACSLARDYNARLVILYAVTPPVMIYGGGVFPAFPEAMLERARAELDELQLPIADIDVQRRVEEGDVATVIVDVAQEIDADFIVMGTHGRSALGRFLMGSVADRVVRKAHCPVLTVTHPLTAVERDSEADKFVSTGGMIGGEA